MAKTTTALTMIAAILLSGAAMNAADAKPLHFRHFVDQIKQHAPEIISAAKSVL